MSRVFLQLWQYEEGVIGEIVNCLNKFRAWQSPAATAAVIGPIGICLPPLKRIRWLVPPFVIEVEEEEDDGKDGDGKVEKNQSHKWEDRLSGDPFEGAVFGFLVKFEG